MSKTNQRNILAYKTLIILICSALWQCTSNKETLMEKTAAELLGNPNYKAIAYGGYRNQERSIAPTVAQIMEDMRLLAAMDIHFIRTYHARLYSHAENTLEAIRRLQEEDASFEMYVMLGCWMQCHKAWTAMPNHQAADTTENNAELVQAVKLAQAYPTIVKVIAVGNEAMVHWAATYYVSPQIILDGVNFLQDAKKNGEIEADIWITSSDNFASWGGEKAYQGETLEELIKAVDYLSVHSYPFHDTHYNPDFWYLRPHEKGLSKEVQIDNAMNRCIERVQFQLDLVASYLKEIGVEKTIHIGETGWATTDNHLYGNQGSHAADPFKQALYHHKMRAYTDSARLSCFYFEAFDEPWKDGQNEGGSENHFGLFDKNGYAKWILQPQVEGNVFKGLGRNDKSVKPLYPMPAAKDSLLNAALVPPVRPKKK
jgi:exo-beta-1,3-glucanase (GH17 family)